jgi:hypothetical protein
MSVKDSIRQMHEAIADMFERNTPVAKKSFDISEHEFSDTEVECVIAAVDKLLLINHFGDNSAMLDKQDAIAIAKALGVTGEDLL